MRRVGRTAAWRRRPTAGKRTEPLEQTAAPRGWAGVRWEATTLAIAKRKSLFAEPQRGQRKRGSTRELWAPAEALQPGPARCSFCYRTHASGSCWFQRAIHFDTHAPPTNPPSVRHGSDGFAVL